MTAIPAELARRLVEAAAKELLRTVTLVPGCKDPVAAAKKAIDEVRS